MSAIDWKKYIWKHHEIGSILDIPYRANTNSNLELLYTLGRKQHKNPDSLFACRYINLSKYSLSFTFSLPDYNELEFQFRTTWKHDIIICINHKSYNVSLGNMTFGNILVFMIDVLYVTRQRCTNLNFDMFSVLQTVLDETSDIKKLSKGYGVFHG